MSMGVDKMSTPANETRMIKKFLTNYKKPIDRLKRKWYYKGEMRENASQKEKRYHGNNQNKKLG